MNKGTEHTEPLKIWRCPECGEFEQSRNGRVDRWTRNTRYGYEPHPRHWHGEVGTALHRYVPAEEVEVIPVDGCVKGTLAERLDARIERFDGGCWFWLGGLTHNGYGEISVKHHGRLAHRVVYERQVGPVPEGFHLDHLCRNPSCVNPRHLEAVPAAVNIKRGLLGKLKETCANGHPWIPENWMDNGKGRAGNGVKRCRICFQKQRAKARRK